MNNLHIPSLEGNKLCLYHEGMAGYKIHAHFVKRTPAGRIIKVRDVEIFVERESLPNFMASTYRRWGHCLVDVH